MTAQLPTTVLTTVTPIRSPVLEGTPQDSPRGGTNTEQKTNTDHELLENEGSDVGIKDGNASTTTAQVIDRTSYRSHIIYTPILSLVFVTYPSPIALTLKNHMTVHVMYTPILSFAFVTYPSPIALTLKNHTAVHYTSPGNQKHPFTTATNIVGTTRGSLVESKPTTYHQQKVWNSLCF